MTTRHDYHSNITPKQYFAKRVNLASDSGYLHLESWDILPFSVDSFLRYMKDEDIKCYFVCPLDLGLHIYLAFEQNNTLHASIKHKNWGCVLGYQNNINPDNLLNTVVKTGRTDVNLGILSSYFDEKREIQDLNHKISKIFDLKVVKVEHNLPRTHTVYHKDLFYRITLHDTKNNMIKQAQKHQIYIDQIKSQLCDSIEINSILTIEDITIGYSYLPHKSMSNIIVNLVVNYNS